MTNEEKRAYARAYRVANIETFKARAKEYHAANKEKIAAYGKAYREANKERLRADREARMYNMPPGEYEERVAEQNGCCAICRQPTEKLFIDHCHNTEEVRGLLCNHCNVGIGMLKDDTLILTNAIKYLEMYK